VPSPVAAMSVSAAVLAAITGPPALTWLPLLFAVAAAPLMISEIRYKDLPSLVGWLVRAKWPLPALALLAYAVGNAAIALSVFFASYFISGGLVGRPSKSVQRRAS
jgi:phosphatidylserine synthase